MPAQPPHDPRHLARLYLGLVPDEVKKSISAAELNDRIVEASRLGEQAADPALSTPLRQAAKLRAQAVLRAQPRDVTQRRHAALIAKAASASPAQAAAIRRQAERLVEEEHPMAPRRAAAAQGVDRLADEAAARAVAKAGRQPVLVYGPGRVPLGVVRRGAIVTKAGSREKAPMQAVFDQDGNLVGVVAADAIQPVAGSGGSRDAVAAPPAQAQVPATAAAPAPAQAAGQVAKTAPRPPARAADSDARFVQQVVKALGPKKWMPVHDWLGKPAGIVKRKHVTVPPPGRVAKGAAAERVANVYDARRRKLGEAPLTAITSVPQLRAQRGRVRR